MPLWFDRRTRGGHTSPRHQHPASRQRRNGPQLHPGRVNARRLGTPRRAATSSRRATTDDRANPHRLRRSPHSPYGRLFVTGIRTFDTTAQWPTITESTAVQTANIISSTRQPTFTTRTLAPSATARTSAPTAYVSSPSTHQTNNVDNQLTSLDGEQPGKP